MKLHFWCLSALVVVLASAPASAAPVEVDLRVEGEDATIFEGPVTTDGHSIEQDRSGPHACDGTNAGVNPAPGPTITSALDDAIAWDGSWSDSLQDFSINRIGPDANDTAGNKFWGYAVNYVSAELGGCQQQVKAGDEVLFAYDFFSASAVLKLSGPRRVERGERFTVTVVNGADNQPVEDAEVRGKETNAEGEARIRIRRTGRFRLKAEKDGTIRSNALSVRVRR